MRRWLGEEVRSVGGSQSSYPRSLSESLLAKLAGACSVPSRKCPRHGGLAQMLDASPKSSACTRSQRVNLQQDWQHSAGARVGLSAGEEFCAWRRIDLSLHEAHRYRIHLFRHNENIRRCFGFRGIPSRLYILQLMMKNSGCY